MLACDEWMKDAEWMAELLKDENRARDFYHPNEHELVPYLVDDGKKHPFAIICPGGAYGMVCSYVEGEPFAVFGIVNINGASGIDFRLTASRDNIDRTILILFRFHIGQKYQISI